MKIWKIDLTLKVQNFIILNCVLSILNKIKMISKYVISDKVWSKIYIWSEKIAFA